MRRGIAKAQAALFYLSFKIVPAGRSIIAHRFNGGWQRERGKGVPPGTKEPPRPDVGLLSPQTGLGGVANLLSHR